MNIYMFTFIDVHDDDDDDCQDQNKRKNIIKEEYSYLRM